MSGDVPENSNPKNNNTMKKILLMFALVGALSACCSDNKCNTGAAAASTAECAEPCKTEKHVCKHDSVAQGACCDTLKNACTGSCADCATGCKSDSTSAK